jgi:hypothetical protein
MTYGAYDAGRTACTGVRTGRTNTRTARTSWAAGFAVASGAAIATAHGLYEVARAAGAPTPIAGLYPLITDGLALVAYATTVRLYGRGRSYAWTIVVLAAALSGLAQAAFLAGGVDAAPTWLRFGVGAWPATAAAITAHLLHLLAASYGTPYGCTECVVRPYGAEPDPVRPADAARDAAAQVDDADPAVRPADPAADAASAGERAREAAGRHQCRHGGLPTVSELMRLADVGRGTAGAVLKQLRAERPSLHAVPADPRTDR